MRGSRLSAISFLCPKVSWRCTAEIFTQFRWESDGWGREFIGSSKLLVAAWLCLAFPTRFTIDKSPTAHISKARTALQVICKVILKFFVIKNLPSLQGLSRGFFWFSQSLPAAQRFTPSNCEDSSGLCSRNPPTTFFQSAATQSAWFPSSAPMSQGPGSLKKIPARCDSSWFGISALCSLSPWLGHSKRPSGKLKISSLCLALENEKKNCEKKFFKLHNSNIFPWGKHFYWNTV